MWNAGRKESMVFLAMTYSVSLLLGSIVIRNYMPCIFGLLPVT